MAIPEANRASSETVEIIKQLFISKFSEYKIGDKFQKIETIFYKTKEEISKSIKSFQIEDLLDRKPILLDKTAISNQIKNKDL